MSIYFEQIYIISYFYHVKASESIVDKIDIFKNIVKII